MPKILRGSGDNRCRKCKESRDFGALRYSCCAKPDAIASGNYMPLVPWGLAQFLLHFGETAELPGKHAWRDTSLSQR